MIIRFVLIIAIAAIILWFLHHRSTTRGQAWSKVGVTLLLLFAIAAILLPEDMNKLANFFGVGRGADLVLYGETVLFLGSLLTQYLHRQDDHLKMIQLARKIAIAEANRIPGNLKKTENLKRL